MILLCIYMNKKYNLMINAQLKYEYNIQMGVEGAFGTTKENHNFRGFLTRVYNFNYRL